MLLASQLQQGVILNDFNQSQMIIFSVWGAVAGLSGEAFFHKRGVMAEYCQALAPLLLPEM